MPPAATPPAIDGTLDEAAWIGAAHITELIQTEPLQGAAPGEKTEVLLMYDAANLYIGVHAFDREPQRIIATQRQHDSDLTVDDSIGLVLDTFDDHRHGYYFATNPLGSQAEALLAVDSIISEWDGEWRVAAHTDATGWTAELAIPLRTLSFDPRNDTWGFNIERFIARRYESDRWTALQRNQSLISLSATGALTGLAGMKYDPAVELIPHLTMRATRDHRTGETRTRTEPGLDLTVQPTAQTRLGLTVNTDFAEADVDQRVVNLTRFPIALPEKRGFFLQDANYFKFTAATPFYSRAIGIAPDGTPQTLNGGAKLTGRKGRLVFGVLGVETDDYPGVSRQDLFVGRAKVEVGDESALGMIFTQGDPTGLGDNTVWGADIQLTDSRFTADEQAAAAHAFYLHSEDDGTPGEAYGLGVEYPNDRWNGSASYTQASAQYRPALGLSTPGVRSAAVALTRTWRPPVVQSVSLGASGSRMEDLDGRLLTQSVRPLILILSARDFSEFDYKPVLMTEQYLTPFILLPGVEVPAGAYRYWRHEFTYATPWTDRLSGAATLTTGNYLDGRRHAISLGAGWRPDDRFGLYPVWSVDDIDLPAGRFRLTIAEFSAALGLAPRSDLNVVVQHDNLSELTALNLRLRHTFAPGRDVFLVLGRTSDTASGGQVPHETNAIFKIAWSLRY